MVESPAFFEAYSHVLRGLQEMDAKRIPFQRYVVMCKGRVRPPQYLPPHSTYLDMRPLLKTGSRAKTSDGPEEEMGPTQEQGMEWECAEVSEERDCPVADRPEAEDSEPPVEVEGRPADETGHPAARTDGPEEGEKVPRAGHPGPAEEFISITEPSVEEGGSRADGAQCLQQTGMETTLPVQHARALPGQVGSPSPENKYLVNPFQQDLHSLRWLRHFDRSQLKALQKALTREFAIIQGPPGTGKTFIGLKLVQLLLHNARLWQAGAVSGQDTPILIVCNTNHTLDLFLEGLLESNCSKIVRIGGFCKNKELQSFTLENIRKTRLHAMLTPLQRHRFKEIKKKIEDTKADIVYCSKVLEMLPVGILQDEELAPEMKADVEELGLPSIPLSNSKSGVVLEWLKIPLHLRPQTDTDRRPAPRALGTDQAQEGINPTRYFPSGPSQEAAPTVNTGFVTSNEEEGEWVADGSAPRDPPCSAEQWAGRKFAYLTGADTRDGELAICRCLSEQSVMSAEEVRDVDSVWELPLDHRWRLYRRWRAAYQDKLNASMSENLELYESLAQDLQALELEETLMLLGEAAVIGMTTLGTARYRTLLQHVRPQIVVFEEAAEVLEAQVLTTLTPDCQHLIMIGDHRQLRPKVANYRNAAKMRLDISLFERMVLNQIPFVQLSQQHRMRPEISQLMVPMFYPSLRDHRSVTHYKDVRGMVNNVFFLQHQESEARGLDSGGHVNEHEARLLVGLSRHLLGQGYSPGQLTLLSPYAAQLQRIRALAVGLRLRVMAVDDFQGQESDIVLLSLVRSNRDGQVGFLRDRNRLCVALSRARVGFYCVGDLQNLRRGLQGAAWDGFLQLLRDRGLTGEALPLVCPRHPRGCVLVRAPQDFPRPQGCGCSEGRPCRGTFTRQCEHASCSRECDQP
ncbi:NFX1-type zinc finger-containing protein 1-like [Pristis pectinata]|uniref:NFX1-type zinc finger-containing protein 1-like n=1 Tax=Pristis pectinata TaxID=685728 RepID=UPI00223DF633|nr:NFX1-type zinc finger-containing protein 1-like [Pristis pectinata]